MKYETVSDIIADRDRLRAAPSDCFSTGPPYGDARDETCPACEDLRFLETLDDSPPTRSNDTMTTCGIRLTAITVAPVGQATYTEIRICDEAAGEFVLVSQHGRIDIGKIMITPKEWPTIRWAIDRMIEEGRCVTAEMAESCTTKQGS